ncbi:MAG TPA: hypothetical protein H9749_09850 [Candidatus Acutalibacter stercorigallinarum]|nr:hypothetical protein [Candidatus Acutalibacter stercorigallinarum]
MAKYVKQVTGDFDAILEHLHQAVLGGSMSASYEDGSDYSQGDFRCAVRVYERYSWTGGNRVSMSLTLAGANGSYFLTAITSGGSQATFFKLNTFGEEAFLETIAGAINDL